MLDENCLLDEKLKKAENKLSKLTKENSSLKESSIATTLRMEYLEKSLEFYVKEETKFITELIGMMKTDDMRRVNVFIKIEEYLLRRKTLFNMLKIKDSEDKQEK